MPQDLGRHLVPILDFRDEATATGWQEIQLLIGTCGLGGILLRGGKEADWLAIRRTVDQLPSPPLLMADLEQGAASQLPEHAWLPSAAAVGATGDPEFAWRMGQLIGRQAKALGLDLILAPVADLCLCLENPIMGPRCFGSRADRVADMVGAFVKGCGREGVGTVVKHFPGHGRAGDDSHTILPMIQLEKDVWRRTDLLPFAAAIKAGTRGVMIGHLWISGLDPGETRPASLSQPVMKQLLREELGFSGLIITDSLDMVPVSPGDVRIAEKMINAGADLVLGVKLDEPSGSAPKWIGLPEIEVQAHAPVATLEDSVHVLAQTIARSSLGWFGDRQPRWRIGESVQAVLVCADGTRQAWAEEFIRAVQECSPGVCVTEGLLEQAVVMESEELIIVIGRASGRIEEERAHSVFGTLQAERRKALVVLLGVPKLLPAATVLPVLVGGDAISETQRAAVDILWGKLIPSGNPDLVC